MSVIWQGLDLVFKSHIGRVHKGSSPHAFPFRMYQLPSRFNRGTFSIPMMGKFVDLWKRLNPKAKVGGRVAMDAVELRMTIFVIRAYIDFVRGRRHSHRLERALVKTRLQLDDQSFDQLKIRSNRVILTLERHLKRANRAMQHSISAGAFVELMQDWRAHMQWMRLHIAYFKPPPPVVPGRKIWQQNALDELMKLAESGIWIAGYQPPDDQELRRMMRLYVRSARRDREGKFTVAFSVNHKLGYFVKDHLANFVLKRLQLKERPKS
jgi:hypothetical protein